MKINDYTSFILGTIWTLLILTTVYAKLYIPLSPGEAAEEPPLFIYIIFTIIMFIFPGGLLIYISTLDLKKKQEEKDEQQQQ